jgi:hypothetical protein
MRLLKFNKYILETSAVDSQYQDLFLLLDEVPSNSDPESLNILWGKPSGDWTGLNLDGINFIMALKPTQESSNKGLFNLFYNAWYSNGNALDLKFP